ncbi:hypothetical protein MCG98_04345 [Ruminococcus sp. OA3]|uniref:hypothetical protein n=1 Tax=Ruminococcus sp. OA3 TaxID=2914164 RepID=UPI001F05A062|nr:hypothetical protein [Ruminococcus sp. OA3]MCH1981800.1 hypothetical protein [Ruminococcus sp. OA3]
MKKRSYAARFGAMALTLTLVTACLLGGTMARYVTEVSGSATAAVAAWSFKANGKDGTENFMLDLGDTRTAYQTEDIKDKVIAPGTTGKFDIAIDGTGSEVGIDYSVAIAAAAGTTLPDDMVFSTEEITADNAGQKLAEFKIDGGNIPYSDTADAMKKTIEVYWSWAFDADNTKDTNDNEFANEDWTLEITVTGKQATPETPTT